MIIVKTIQDKIETKEDNLIIKGKDKDNLNFREMIDNIFKTITIEITMEAMTAITIEAMIGINIKETIEINIKEMIEIKIEIYHKDNLQNKILFKFWYKGKMCQSSKIEK